MPPSGADPVSDRASPQETPGRNETHLEKLDRNTIELLNELRVAGTGIQVLLAFLLVAPFNQRFKTLTAFERDDYFVTLVCIAVAAALLIAPSVHHRIMFRQGEKSYLVEVGSRLAIVASAFLAVGLTGIIVLITHMVFGSGASIVGGIVAAVVLCGVWFALPLRQLQR